MFIDRECERCRYLFLELSIIHLSNINNVPEQGDRSAASKYSFDKQDKSVVFKF